MKKLLLLLVMILLPMVGSADDSGTCGENLTWELVESTGTLTISGSGAMENYNKYSSAPWYSYKGEILHVVIKRGVTSIGDRAFRSCVLISVTIPNSVTSIGNDAFCCCRSLTSVTIPNSVTSIGDYAFEGCSSLTSVTISNNVTSIGDSAFKSCRSLTSVTIPNSVTFIGNYAFMYSGLTSVTIPNSVTSISIGVFLDCSGLTSVTIPNSVTSIGNSAIRNCSALTSITIPNSVTSIGDRAFLGCSGLTSITIPNSVTSIGESAFSGCSGLTSITIPNSMTSIDDAFSGCSNLTSVTIPNSVTSIGNDAFSGCSGLTSITIPNSVTSIGEDAFRGCSGLTSVTIPNSVTSIGNSAFSGCSLKTVIIGTGVLSIGSGSFSNPTKTIWLTNTPPSGYTYAKGTVNYVANEQYGFSNQTVYPFLSSMFVVDGVRYVPVIPSERTCDAIDCIYDETAESIHIGQTVTNKGITLTVKQVHPYACYENVFIKNVNLGLGGDIGRSAFSGCSSLQTATLGEEVTSIGQSAFYGCSSLQTATLGEEVTSIGQSAFHGCSSLKGIVIPAAIQTLNISTFQDCLLLSSITIPKTVTTISNYVFSGCNSLSKVQIEDSETELTLGSNGSNPLFADCPLDIVYIGRNISYNKTSSYGYSPFYRNTSLRSVTITDKETEISENEFYGCTNLKNVKIGDGVTTIGNWAFSGCSSLDYFAFGSSLQSIGNEAFSDCIAMTKIYSKTTTPPVCGDQALDDINRWNCTLFIPSGASNNYQTADQWKEFLIIKEKDYTVSDEVTVMAKNISRTYGSKNPKLVYDTSGANLKGTPSITCEATITSPIGSYPIIVSKGSVTNEDVVCVNGSLTITKAPLTITAKSYTVKQGEALPSFAAEYSGFKNNETDAVLMTKPTFSCTATSTAAMGEYEIEVSGASATNYEISYVAGTLKVVEKDAPKIKLSKTKATIEKGKTLTLKATVTPSDLTDKSVTWKSSDTKVATVSSSGKVKGVKAGTATITCTSKATGAKATCKVTVGYVKLDKTESYLEKGKTLTLTATVYPTSLKDQTVTWASSDTKVATVTSAGKVKGVKAGTATITCTSKATGLKTTCKVTVGYVKLDKTEATLEKGKTLTLKATVYPSSLSDRSVTWKSSKTSVATVTSAGKVKAVKAGTATITCTSNATGLKTTCTVNVVKGTVTLNKTEAYIEKGKTTTLKATLTPTTLTDKSVTWTSSDKSIATVSSSGKVKGIKYGSATITCTSKATGASATCKVTIGKVVVSITEVSIKKSRGITLEATVYPTTLTDKSVTWTSSDKSIATVSSSGKVKGVKAGTATITCTSVATGLKGTCKVTVLAVAESRSAIGDDDDATGIEDLEESPAEEEPYDVYDLSGRKVANQVTSLDGLPHGIYIVNGKKMLKR